MTQPDIDCIVAALQAIRCDARRKLVAIDGFGGSGKSTFARALADRLERACVVALDDFIVREHLLDASWERTFDRRRLVEQVLEPALSGAPIAYQRTLWDAGGLSEAIPIPDSECLIVEGISALHPELAQRYDYSIWIDAPIELARARGRARDAGTEHEQHWDLWSANDLRYREAHRPDATADAIVGMS